MKLCETSSAVVIELLRAEVATRSIYAVSRQTGIPHRSLRRILNSGQKQVDFDTADRIVTFIDVSLWHRDPDLAAFFESDKLPPVAYIGRVNATTCKGCGCPSAERTRGCKQCRWRHYSRRQTNKRLAA